MWQVLIHSLIQALYDSPRKEWIFQLKIPQKQLMEEIQEMTPERQPGL